MSSDLKQVVENASAEKIRTLVEAITRGGKYEMPCVECDTRLSEYLAATSEEISASEYLQAVADHLAVCRKCRRLADEIGEMVRVAFGEE